MATIKDIAKLAGVSHGTASNVLNKRGNVSASKIQKVEEAAKKLGYQLNPQAQLLRKGASDKISLLIPFERMEQYQDFFQSIYSLMSGISLELTVNYFTSKNLDIIFEKELLTKPKLIIFAGYLPQENLLEKVKPDTNIVLFDVYDSENQSVPLIKYDLELVVSQIVEYANLKNYDKCVFLSMNHRIEYGRFDCLAKMMESEISTERVLVDNELGIANFLNTIKNKEEKTLFLIEDDLLHQKIQLIVQQFSLHFSQETIVFGNRKIIHDYHARYEFNDKYCAKIIVDAVKAENIHNISTVLIPPAGIYFKEKKSIIPKNKKTIRLLTISSPTSDAMQILTEPFYRQSGILVEIEEWKYGQFVDEVLCQRNVLERFDLIRLDMALLPSLGKKIFQNLNTFDAAEKLEKMVPDKLLDEYMYVDDEWFSMPLDVSVQLMFYRKDYWLNPLNQRRYFEIYRTALSIPKTFEDFDRMNQFFTKSLQSQSQSLYGHSVAMESPIVAACDFLPRYREKLLKFNKSEALKQSIEEYKKSLESTDYQKNKWWGDVADDFAKGKTATMILFSNYASRIMNVQHENKDFEFGVARVPGAQPLIGGGAIGVSKYSANKNEAIQYLKWLYRKDVANLVVGLGGMIFNEDVMKNQELLERYPWLNHLPKSLELGKRHTWNHQNFTVENEHELGKYLIEQVD